VKVPKLVAAENGIQYSDWVIGEYDNTSICRYRIVRRGMREEKVFWEAIDLLGDDEDLWAIKEPDVWHPLQVKRG
jgi:hypothetical protein